MPRLSLFARAISAILSRFVVLMRGCATPKRENRMRRSEFHVTQLLFATLACFSFHQHARAADPGQSIIPQLQERFGLSEAQVRGSLGALLVFVRERLPRPEFDRLSKGIPNADYIMREVRMRGIVTRPLDDIEDYEASLASLGIGQPLASQLAPAVLEYLAARGFERERSALARVLD
jgi:hypothetical protein